MVKDIHNEDSPVEVYRFKRDAFGVNSSQFILNVILTFYINKYKEEDSDIAMKLADNFYVDDLLSGTFKFH